MLIIFFRFDFIHLAENSANSTFAELEVWLEAVYGLSAHSGKVISIVVYFLGIFFKWVIITSIIIIRDWWCN